ncbi:MAG: NUDIX hydrolase [Rhodospirillaceae bacterium]
MMVKSEAPYQLVHANRCRQAYRDLVAARPELFDNSGGSEAITIVLEEAEIDAIEQEMARRLASQGLPVSWATIGVLSEDQYAWLVRDAVRFGDGSPGTYFRLIAKPWQVNGVVVIPILDQGPDQGLVLIRQYRHATRSWQWEFPRGRIDPGDQAEAAARKEAFEEAGAIVDALTPLGEVHTTAGLTSECLALFAARTDRIGSGSAAESIADPVVLRPQAIEAMIADGQISCGISITAYFRAKLAGLLESL